jgi:hypothetical protein
MFSHYNTKMGGVDLLDCMVSCYRVSYRMKKWWYPFYTWSLSVSAVNAWRLRMSAKGTKEPLLDFVRELVMEMLTVHGTPPLRRRSLNGGDAGETLRYDGLNHWIVGVEEDAAGKSKRRNCKHCYLKEKKELKTVTQCEKCKVPLHTACFKEGFIVYFLNLFYSYKEAKGMCRTRKLGWFISVADPECLFLIPLFIYTGSEIQIPDLESGSGIRIPDPDPGSGSQIRNPDPRSGIRIPNPESRSRIRNPQHCGL